MVDERRLIHASAQRVALFRARVSALFDRLPMLCGFHVTDDLRAVEIAVHTWPGWEHSPKLAQEIAAALELLIVDRAEDTAALLRGTTFARRMH